MKNIYLRFIQIVSFEKIHQHKDLSPTAILLLNEIAVKDFEQHPLNVSQALELCELGSPANLHRKLGDLLDAGMISLEHVGTNRRTKYLMITEAARDYFQIKNDAMLKAVQSR